EHFVHAYLTYDPEKSEFYRWVRTIIWYRLLSTKRKQAKFAESWKQVPMEFVESERFNLQKFMYELSPDSIRTVLIAINLFYSGEHRPSIIRKKIISRLRKSGWKKPRIEK